jgi:cytochrome bd-type quinol oxidase subunit 1
MLNYEAVQNTIIVIFFWLQRGRFYEMKGELAEAKACFENAVAINPSHVISLQHLVFTAIVFGSTCLMPNLSLSRVKFSTKWKMDAWLKKCSEMLSTLTPWPVPLG